MFASTYLLMTFRRMVLRAARVRQERVEYGKQYDQWKMTQRSKWYSSIGMTARERLDQHASELKQARDLNEKTLTGLIDTLSQTLENAQTLKLEPLLEETKRYLSEAKTWLESARPHLPPMPIPIPMPLQAQVQHGDVEMESGEISEEATPSVSSLKRRRKDDGHRDEWTTIQLARIEALQEKFDELEGETTQGLSVDVNALVERALATLRAREDTELGDPAESMEPTQFVKLQEQQERLDAQLRDGQSKKDALMAKMQVIDTDFASWKARCSQAELKCQEVRILFFSSPIY